jgi:hypothetical protein
MALELGALRKALINAGADTTMAETASEEVAGYENRLTRQTTMVQAMLAIGLMMLASQGALWLEIGKLDGSMVALNTKVDLIARAVNAH